MSTSENSERRTSRSPEDQDTLERSTKKTKRLPSIKESDVMEGIEEEGLAQTESRDEDCEMENEVIRDNADKVISYKRILTGEEEGNRKEKSEEDLVSDDESDDKEKEGDVDCPAITLTKEEKVRLRKPWRQSLIIKVLGKKVGYAYLLKRLNTIWHPKSRMELITLENDYFLVKFGSVYDYEFAKYGGPWMIMEHYLIIKEWRPNFDPYTDTTEKVIVWVRLPDLPIEYYDHEFLFRVGEKIGKPIRIDSATSLTSRGKFARLCVEVDITKPLLAKFWLRRRVRRIEYEGIHLVCFKCGVYGHSHDMCSKEEEREGNLGDVPENAAGDQRNDGGSTKGKNQSGSLEPEIRPEISESFGPWMIAKRNTRKQYQSQTRKEGSKKGGNLRGSNGNEQRTNKESMGSGSRFMVLEERTQEEQLEEPINEENEVDKNEMGVDNGLKKSLKSKSRRPAVQVNEKQDMENNRNNEEAWLKTNDRNTGEKVARGTSSRTRNKAGEEDEHIFVRGENHGTVITSTKVSNRKADSLLHGIPELSMQEHHEDPPSPHDDMGIDLNFSVNENGLYDEFDVHGEGTSTCGVQFMEV